jgi:GNAT superfamily N-acetyltransferase
MEAALAEAVKALQAERIIFGQDHGSFWPGIPEELVDRFEGWTINGQEADVERDLAGYRPYPGCLEAMGDTVECRPARPEDAAILERFLVREFPGRWHYDTMRKLAQEPEEIDILIEGGECIGFSFTQSQRSSQPIGGALRRPSLGADWRALGPIGVGAQVRGRGLGHALLGASLLRMAESGGRQCLIDWTTLLDFYGRHGFEPARIYRPAFRLL